MSKSLNVLIKDSRLLQRNKKCKIKIQIKFRDSITKEENKEKQHNIYDEEEKDMISAPVKITMNDEDEKLLDYALLGDRKESMGKV